MPRVLRPPGAHPDRTLGHRLTLLRPQSWRRSLGQRLGQGPDRRASGRRGSPCGQLGNSSAGLHRPNRRRALDLLSQGTALQGGTTKHWDSELKGLVLFVGKRSKTWYFQKDLGGQTKRILIGHDPTISADAARQTAMGLSLDMSRGAGRTVQTGAPQIRDAIEAYLARPKLRSDIHKHELRRQLHLHLRDWLRDTGTVIHMHFATAGRLRAHLLSAADSIASGA